MNRDYSDGVSSTPVLFVGKEVERSKNYMQQTLFVVGLNFTLDEIVQTANDNECTHIYLAANHSYPGIWPAYIWVEWCKNLKAVGFNVTLEVAYEHAKPLIHASKEHNFVLMVGCAIPNIHENIVIKADDIDFKATNPGVWTMTPTESKVVHFTSWDSYKQDKVIR